MNGAVIERTAASLLVEHLDLEQYHVGTVGLCAFGVLYRCEFQLVGFTHRLQFIATAIRGYSLQRTCLKRHIIEGKEITVTLLTLTETLTIQEQFHLIASRNHIHRFLK